MKKLMFALLLIGSLSGFTQTSHSNSIKINKTEDSESGRFAVATPKLDTLYINIESGTGQLLCSMWLDGVYKDTKPFPVIIKTDTTTIREVEARVFGEGVKNNYLQN